MDVIARIDQARRRWNVLEHPFYQRWSAGELSAEELALYSGQYRHAVIALAEASSAVAERAGVSDSALLASHAAGLERHAAEEASHVAMWDEFAKAACAAGGLAGPAGAATVPAGPVGAATGSAGPADAAVDASAAAPSLAETRRCAEAWTAGEDAAEHLAVLYAIEASQPEIAKTKLEGLVERYGYSPEGPATEYFRLHATLDVEHARQARDLIERLLDGVDGTSGEARGERMAARAEAALEANWALLDGVERELKTV